MMRLLIDDEKNLAADAIARNSRAAFTLLSLKCWTHILLDNDLGEEIEGRHILDWMIENDYLTPTISLVSHNPPAKYSMKQCLLRQGYFPRGNDPWTFDRQEGD